jgi:hypothetical protein
LPQPDTHQRHLAFQIDADDSPLFIEPGDANGIVRLKSLASFTQSRRLICFLLELGDFLHLDDTLCGAQFRPAAADVR